jgi:hypothetical protein
VLSGVVRIVFGACFLAVGKMQEGIFEDRAALYVYRQGATVCHVDLLRRLFDTWQLWVFQMGRATLECGQGLLVRMSTCDLEVLADARE